MHKKPSMPKQCTIKPPTNSDGCFGYQKMNPLKKFFMKTYLFNDDFMFE